jgi:uncharacterized membrane protein
MNDLLDTGSKTHQSFQAPQSLPNATACLVLGIISIAICLIGFITGIIGIILHKKDKEIYATNPAVYEASFKNSKAGYICSIIGLCLSVLVIIFYVGYFILIFTMIDKFDQLQH